MPAALSCFRPRCYPKPGQASSPVLEGKHIPTVLFHREDKIRFFDPQAVRRSSIQAKQGNQYVGKRLEHLMTYWDADGIDAVIHKSIDIVLIEPCLPTRATSENCRHL